MRMRRLLYTTLMFFLFCGAVRLPSNVIAQVEAPITAEGYIYYQGSNLDGQSITIEYPLEITFYPSGGEINGYSFLQLDFTPRGVTQESFLFYTETFCTGFFSGGDGGTISGECIVETWTYKTGEGESEKYEDTMPWQGNLYADGTGYGYFSEEIKDVQFWQVGFSPHAFAARLVPEITREYIFTTYGISVEDSFGDDGWAQKAWSDQELGWLDDVLKVIPSHLIERMALKRIVRNEIEIDDGQPRPDTMGLYTPCDRSVDPGCDGSSATIRIFDRAYNPVDFPNDPERQFKATILHELVHAMQNHKGKNEIYPNVYNSPLVQNYMDATRQILDIEHPDYASHNGWRWYGAAHGWRYTNDTSSQPATSYGGTDPVEDMAEAVMMYVYEPERLQRSSWQRYYFIRDEMFGGVEYENGHPKP